MPLTAELRHLVVAMVSSNDGTPGISPADFLAASGVDDGPALAHRVLLDALAEKNEDDVYLAMVLLEKFGGSIDDVEPLLALTGQTWHSCSNEAFFRLGAIGRPEAIGPLLRIAQTLPRPDHDDIDERTLANNAVYSIAQIGGTEARRALEHLRADHDAARALLAARLLSELVLRTGSPSERTTIENLFAAFRTAVNARDVELDWSPYVWVEGWRRSVDDAAAGTFRIDELTEALANRDRLDLSYGMSPAFTGDTWVDLIHHLARADSDYRDIIADGPVIPVDERWWRRRLPARAHERTRIAVRERYHLELDRVVDTDHPGPYYLSRPELPDGFSYPPSYRRMVTSGFVAWKPWRLLDDELPSRIRGLRQRYPDRLLVPFARRDDRDDVACWDLDRGSGVVVVIDDFQDAGFEQVQEFSDIDDWLRSAVEQFIAWED